MKWVSVKDRLPEARHEVIVWCEGAECAGLAWRHEGSDFWYVPEPQAIGYDSITHWMPLPEAP